MKVVTKSIELPNGVCLACFNDHQRFTFPFLVYCRHGRTLAVVHSREEHDTFDCAPDQLDGVVDRLKSAHMAPKSDPMRLEYPRLIQI